MVAEQVEIGLVLEGNLKPLSQLILLKKFKPDYRLLAEKPHILGGDKRPILELALHEYASNSYINVLIAWGKGWSSP